MIDGVITKNLKVIPDERGWLMEILRSDWNLFEKFGQAYVTAAHPGVVKAWHMHEKQTDYFVCIIGMVKLALYDGRKDSKTYKKIDEFFIGEKNSMLVRIPPKVWHGFKAIGNKIALIINIPTKTYNYEKPDEQRLPPDTKEISYEWLLVPWLKHG